MTPVTTAKVKYGVWGLICGAIIAMIIGFAWGGWPYRRERAIRPNKSSFPALSFPLLLSALAILR